MDNTGDLKVLLASRHPLIVAETRDERRFIGLLRRAAAELEISVWTWSLAHGLARDGCDPQYDTRVPAKALGHVASLPGAGVFVFFDFHRALDDPLVIRQVKEMAQVPTAGRTVVLTAPRAGIPPELDGLAIPWKLTPPGDAEMRSLVGRTIDHLAQRNLRISLDALGRNALAEAAQGLSSLEAERLIQEAALSDGALDAADIPEVRLARAQLLDAGRALELVESAGTLERVGGMHRLKKWLGLRGRAREPDAQEFGLEAPRGILLTGVPGCGKSLVAKTIAGTWELPLVLLDPARLYGRFVGESEERLGDALSAVEAMAPVVMWIDEIEKGFSSGGESDGGVSQRLLGTFLRWMQERPSGVFLVATANDVQALPPEFLRKGRFDEIFFVDLPGQADRQEIFRLHLGQRGRDPAAFDLPALARASDGRSGAEIEAALVGALYRAYGDGRELSDEDILQELAASVPLAVARAEDVARLRAWAAERAISV